MKVWNKEVEDCSECPHLNHVGMAEDKFCNILQEEIHWKVKLLENCPFNKELTKEDIEKFGFKFKSHSVRDWYILEGFFDLPISPAHRVQKYTMQHDYSLRGIKIIGQLVGDIEEDTFYEGKCSNPQELEFILKLLNIID